MDTTAVWWVKLLDSKSYSGVFEIFNGHGLFLKLRGYLMYIFRQFTQL